ncbi:MAG: hypothetical protein KDE58_24480, partial [Caldilineaceae bacterium]|nr:hypothetical protein [Caldilineaceae bacterium]
PSPCPPANEFQQQKSPTRFTVRRLMLLAVLMALFMLVTTAACPPYGDETPATCPLYPSPHLRMGFNVAREGGVSIDDYDVAQLHAGWYLDYNRQYTPSHPAGMIYHQMLRTSLDTTKLAETIGTLVDANPGAIWVLGNEPDRYGQDEMTPAEYATFYHKVYTFLKERDPTSRVAVGAIVQATPIRLRYLDMVLAEYQSRFGAPLPTDIWTLHNFLLPEQCSWGAHVPPGLEAYASEGIPCLSPLSEHGNITIFQERIVAFRQWMRANGYRNYPLIVSEYGILLTPFHGFSYPVVRDYMTASFDFMLNTTDSELGYPLDSNRLVQQFAWFSLNYYAYSPTIGQGLNGNLFDHDSKVLLDLGQDYANYAAKRVVRFTDLQLASLTVASPPDGRSAPITVDDPITITGSIRNLGAVAATNVTMRFWLGPPGQGGELLGTVPVAPQALPDCGYQYAGDFVWRPPAGGSYTIYADLQSDNPEWERNLANNQQKLTIAVVEAATVTPTPLVTATPTPTHGGNQQPTATQAATSTPTLIPTLTPNSIPVEQHAVLVAPGQAGQLRFTTQDGQQVVVAIAADAVDEATTIEIAAQQNPPGLQNTFHLIDGVFAITAKRNGATLENFVLKSPMVIAVHYAEPVPRNDDEAEVDEDDITLYYYDEKRMAWRQDGITLLTRDSDRNCLEVIVAHFAAFALLVPAPHGATPTPDAASVYLPMILGTDQGPIRSNQQ